MRLSTGKLQYNENGSFVSINEEISADVNKVGTPSRSNWNREGFYINETIDSITVNFKRGYNKILDNLNKQDEIELKLNTGAVIYQGTFSVSEKFNTKPQGQEYTNTYILFTFPVYKLDGTINEMTIKSTASGVASGVQDVQIEGKSIVDESTGIANITTLTTKSEFETATEKVTEALTSLENYCDALDATKLDTISYIELSGTKGTLTDEQRATLLSGSPTLNFIDKDGMLFKCVFYSANKKAVYSIAGESKIHVITVTLPAGTWALVTYSLQPTLTAGDGITIKNNVISATGGSGGGVSQTYVDEQDQAILATATERIDEESSARQSADSTLKTSITEESTRATNSEALLARNMSALDSFLQTETEERTEMDATLSESILNETDNRTAADTTLQTNIDNEVVARTEEDVKLQANIEEEAATRQAVDEKLLTAINNKQDILTAGTNITITSDGVISATGGGSGASSISLKGTSGTITTDQLKVLGENFANYILVIGSDSTVRRFVFVQEPMPSMDLHYVCINQNKVDLLTITQGNNRWSITDGDELAKQSDLEAVDAKLGEDENGIYVDL